MISSSGCLDNNDESPDSNNNTYFNYDWCHYEARLNTSSIQNYTLFLPVPVSSDISVYKKNETSKIINELNILNGSVSICVINSSGEYLLKIEGCGSFNIFAEKQIDLNNDSMGINDRLEYSFFNLSTNVYRSLSSRVYFNTTETIDDFVLSYNIYYKHESKTSGVFQPSSMNRYTVHHHSLTIGWQECFEEREKWVGD